MLDISAFSGSLKAQEEVSIWRETNSIAGAYSLSSSVFIRLESEGRRRGREERNLWDE